MPALCELCKVKESTAKLILTTLPCKHFFHASCVMVRLNLGSVEQAKDAIIDHCPACDLADCAISRFSAILQSVEQKMSKQTEEMTSMTTSMDKLRGEVATLTASNERMTRRVDAHDAQFKQVDKRCGLLEASVKDLTEEVRSSARSAAPSASQQRCLRQLKASQLRDEVVVTGIPEGAEGSLIQVILTFLSLIGATIERSSILSCHRLGKRVQDKRRAVRVKFSTVTLVDQILQAKRKKGIVHMSDINPSWSKSAVVNVNRRVPQDLLRLRTELLRTIQAIPANAVWYEDASVLVRYDNKIWRISDKTDLTKLQSAVRATVGAASGVAQPLARDRRNKEGDPSQVHDLTNSP